MAAGLGCLGEDFELGGEWAVESSSVRLTTASGDHGNVSVLAEELFQIRKGVGGFREGIEPKFNEFEVSDCGFGSVKQFCRRAALNGDAHFPYAQTRRRGR